MDEWEIKQAIEAGSLMIFQHRQPEKGFLANKMQVWLGQCEQAPHMAQGFWRIRDSMEGVAGR